ncbi:hypothetical protein GCM10010206_49070 [Streptomyces cinerochromogenes]|nr:hypothetical protein GCM10010206_49070 [Streptomyces cinerochromogenes]
MKRVQRMQRAAGVVVGSAVGDALGGPFEFGPRGAFSARFPVPGAGGEMSGGGGWDPGEATDDTQMAVLVAESLLSGADWIWRTSSPASSGGPRQSRRTSACRPRTS